LSLSEINIALIELESEGFVLRGRFTEEASSADAVAQGDPTLEWCERRLLARIHRYTIKTLRAEIVPVSSADFMRFLFEWQGVTRQPKPEGVESLAAVITQLEGYEVPAAAWEGDVLPARLNEYDPHWLDSLCLAGRALWARLTPAKSVTAAPVRTTPIALVTRRNWSLWHSLAAAPREEVQHSHSARALYDYFSTHGASFFDDLVSGTKLLRTQAETALGELVSAGLVNAGQLFRSACAADPQRQAASARGAPSPRGAVRTRRRRALEPDTKGAAKNEAEALEQVAEILLRRYGGVSQGSSARRAGCRPGTRCCVFPARGAGKDSRRALRRRHEW
jgi:ATP-dependent Lhr-like helicase